MASYLKGQTVGLARGRALERKELLSDERVEKFIYDHLCKQKRSFGPEDVAYLRDFVKQLEAKP